MLPRKQRVEHQGVLPAASGFAVAWPRLGALGAAGVVTMTDFTEQRPNMHNTDNSLAALGGWHHRMSLAVFVRHQFWSACCRFLDADLHQALASLQRLLEGEAAKRSDKQLAVRQGGGPRDPRTGGGSRFWTCWQ